jgi:type IV pilus assembly protein PilO
MNLGLDKLQSSAEKLAKLPRSYRIAMIPAVMVIVVGGYLWSFWSPAHTELEGLRAQQLELQRKLNEVRAVAANLSAFEEELHHLDQELTVALRQLPNSKELPVLLTDISSLGKNAGLEFKSFRPKEEVPREFYAEVPIEIEFTGGFHEIASFFDQVSKLPRIVNIGELKMKIFKETTDGTLLQVEGNATTFRFLEAASAPPAPAAGARPAGQGAAGAGGAQPPASKPAQQGGEA